MFYLKIWQGTRQHNILAFWMQINVSGKFFSSVKRKTPINWQSIWSMFGSLTFDNDLRFLQNQYIHIHFTCFLMQIKSLFYLYVIQWCNDFIFKLTSEIRVFGVAQLTDRYCANLPQKSLTTTWNGKKTYLSKI